MKRTIALLAPMLLPAATAAQGACFVDYKAKKDNPLRLHYGVMQVGEAACNQGPGAAAGDVAGRLQGGGWTLLNVVSAFREDGLEQRKASAADYFLRF